jgi:anti-sigma B factor antagonist
MAHRIFGESSSVPCIPLPPALGFSDDDSRERPEAAMSLKVESRETDGITVVSCAGRIVLGEEAAGLRDTLKRALGSSRQVVLNLEGVTYIDSSGLGTLVGVYSSARAAGADIKLGGLGERLRDVLQITKLVTVFEVYDTEQQAIAAFRNRPAQGVKLVS